METTLCYARAACDTMMHKFAAADLPPKGHFYYHQGVFLSGVLKTWQLTGEQKYLDYAANWVHAVFDESGKVMPCSLHHGTQNCCWMVPWWQFWWLYVLS